MVESLSDQLRELAKDYHGGRCSEVLYKLGMMPHFIASLCEEKERPNIGFAVKELCGIASKHSYDLIEIYIVALENEGKIDDRTLLLFEKYPDLFIKGAEYMLGKHNSWRPNIELHNRISARSKELTRKMLQDNFELRA